MDCRIKYKELADENWLKVNYDSLKLSTTDIARKIGCTKDAVRLALIRNNISLRKSAESNSILNKKNGYGSVKYELLNDKEWLIEKYEIEGKSLPEISCLVNAKNHNSVRQALNRHGIYIRNQSEGVTYGRKDDGFILDLDVINGCLLGDAGLRKWKKESKISIPMFFKKNKYYDHVLWVANFLFSGENATERIKEGEEKLNGKKYQNFRFDSLTHKELLPLYEKWYPANNDFVKVVPDDLILNEKIMLHWFLDDGTTSWRKRVKKNTVKLTFCSQSFTIDHQQKLCDKINEKWDLNAKTKSTNSGTGYVIGIPESKVLKFFDTIGPCPIEVPSLMHKWKFP